MRQTRSSALFFYLAVVIGLSILARGLFFKLEQQLFSLLILIPLVCWFWRRRQIIRFDLLDICILLLVGQYTLSCLNAANLYNALNWSLQMAVSYSIYLYFSTTLRAEPQSIRQLLRVLVTISGAIAALSLLIYSGNLQLPDTLTEGRLGSFFQYPNTAAAFFLSGFFLTLTLKQTVNSKLESCILQFISSIQMLAFLLCQSRTAFLLVCPLLLLFAFSTPRRSVLSLLVSSLSSIIFAFSVLPVLPPSGTQSATSLVLYLLLIAISFSIDILWQRFCRHRFLLHSKKTKDRASSFKYRPVILFMLAAYILTLSLVFILPSFEGAFQSLSGTLPASLSRLFAIGQHESTFQLRKQYMLTALSIARDHPLLGLGGEGYASIYPRYQAFHSVANSAHSHPFQLLSDTGIPGLIFFLLIWIVLARRFCSVWRNTDHSSEANENKHLILGLVFSVAALLLHSCFDFDLHFGSVRLWLFSLIAMLSALIAHIQSETPALGPSLSQQKIHLGPLLSLVSVSIFVLLIVANTVFLSAEYRAYSLQNNDPETIQDRLNSYEEILKLTGFRSETLVDYSSELLQLYDSSSEAERIPLLQHALRITERAIQADRFAAANRYVRQFALYYQDEAVSCLEGAYQLLIASPFWQEGRELVAASFTRHAFYFIEKGDDALLRPLAICISAWENQTESNDYTYISNTHIQLAQALAHFIRGNDPRAETLLMHLYQNQHETDAAEMLLLALLDRNGRIDEAWQLLGEERCRNLGRQSIYPFLRYMYSW